MRAWITVRTHSADPLEHPVILLDEKILDGRHRYASWMQLAEGGACDGYFARNTPRSEKLDPDNHGTVAAWMKAKSANLIHRHVPADQKAAIFLKASEQFPEIGAALEQIRRENDTKKKKGTPSGAGAPRGNTAAQIGKLAGVGQTTVKQVQRLKRESPEKFQEVASGKASAKKNAEGHA